VINGDRGVKLGTYQKFASNIKKISELKLNSVKGIFPIT